MGFCFGVRVKGVQFGSYGEEGVSSVTLRTGERGECVMEHLVPMSDITHRLERRVILPPLFSFIRFHCRLIWQEKPPDS